MTARPLRVNGRWITDDLGNIIRLGGINKHGFEDDPRGHWHTPSGGTEWNTFNPITVAANLDAMKSWGINCVRSYSTTQFWIENTGDHRQIVKDYATLLSDRDMYLIYSMWHEQPGTDILHFPSNETTFVNMWASIADELKTYPNVIFEFWNEPSLGSGMSGVDTWQRVWQDCIDAVRATGATNLISVHFKASIWVNIVYGNGDTLSYVETNPLNDPLGYIFYSPHNYRTYNDFQKPGVKCFEYDDLKLAMQMSLVEHVLNDLQIPVIIGEFGPNMWESGTELQHELEYYANLMQIMNEWQMGYLSFLWWCTGFSFIHLNCGANYPPNAAGDALITGLAGATPPPPTRQISVDATLPANFSLTKIQ